MKILSTKILTPSQRNLLKGFEIKEIPMIDISFGNGFVIDEMIENAVFTSANSVRSVFEIHQNKANWFTTVYCVGTKTQSLLEKYGIDVTIVAENAVELANVLTQKFLKETNLLKQISWFCGNLKNDDLPNIMAENGVLVTEYTVYNTTLIPKKIEETFDAILFYSPSGIKSYIKANKINVTPVICIGATTATEAVEYFENVYISDTQNVEGVLEKVQEIIEDK
ncbi:uroporphyrinogen-III synthase [Wenyingzhuangia heitensis]|uniref:Uroporphyrinogen-III synthase n=1 Tax=Wenyingzhuangia heitensis TaxID=1487859 RepID=A0ABX0U977_9FLAO|nr:uroporphyrinogen-III synthase [Wenyingzhuangia heitensis]NIJ45397.1 uroporphyrinogen-III synthase [Wenyingzhuangia heitensis]